MSAEGAITTRADIGRAGGRARGGIDAVAVSLYFGRVFSWVGIAAIERYWYVGGGGVVWRRRVRRRVLLVARHRPLDGLQAQVLY